MSLSERHIHPECLRQNNIFAEVNYTRLVYYCSSQSRPIDIEGAAHHQR